jgi:hypothetical protein
MLSNRAGVYLEDATLPSAFLTAAQNGEARVRVTASLQSPTPVRLRRWQGNPFAGRRPAKVFDLTQGYRFQRVADSSIHRTSIEAGTLLADEVDDREALHRWLVERLQQASDGPGDGEAKLTLSGAWPMLRPGDHLRHAGGAETTLHHTAQAVAQYGAVIQALTVSFAVDRGNGPSTRVQLRF